MPEGILKERVTFPSIKSEGHFFQVRGEMFDGDVVPRSHDAALQKREGIFDSVGMDVSTHVDSPAVADGLMAISTESRFHHCFWVANPIVRDNHFCALTDVLADVLGKCSRFGVFDMKKPHISAALSYANDDFFPGQMRATSTALLATNIGFVHFDNSAQERSLCFEHRGTDAMAEIPRCFVAADFQNALHLERGDAFLRFANKEGSNQPLSERQMRIVEHGARRDGKLRLTRHATQHSFAVNNASDFIPFTLRTDWTIGPAELFKERPTLAFAVELLHKVRKADTRQNRRNDRARHGYAPMKKTKKRKTDRQVLKEIFPPEIVREVDETLRDLDGETPKHRSNPPKRPLKPWGRKWVEEKKRESE